MKNIGNVPIVGEMAREWMGRCDVLLRMMESIVDRVEIISVGLEFS